MNRERNEIQPYSLYVEKPWGWEVHWTPVTLPYLGKLIHIHAGARLSLQRHDVKLETWYLTAGRCKVTWDNPDGVLTEKELFTGQGYTCAPGQRHRLEGITDCDLIEVSTPEQGTTWRLEDDFRRPHETPEQRLAERNP